MTIITEQSELEAFCRAAAAAEYVTVDTEFMRDSTYWPKLCLVQVAGPDRAVAIDALAPGIDLEPFYDLLANRDVLKVMHAARQDVEIFWHGARTIPEPLFDTQIAAMVCGYGDSVGYETLVASLTGARIDKVSRFTNWSQRPLTQQQIEYALSDVIHLRDVYEKLRERLEKNGRIAWVEEEDAILTNPDTYNLDPERAYERLKTRSDNPKFLAVLQAAAAWREREAQRRDTPRNWILRDDALLDIAAQVPTNPKSLSRSRGVPKGFAESRAATELLDTISEAARSPGPQPPRLRGRREVVQGVGAIVDLLRVLLKMKCDEHGVAQKLIASASDLEQLAGQEEPDIPALHGWRREVFGESALALKQGRLALALHGKRLATIRLDAEGEKAAPAQSRPGTTTTTKSG